MDDPVNCLLVRRDRRTNNTVSNLFVFSHRIEFGEQSQESNQHFCPGVDTFKTMTEKFQGQKYRPLDQRIQNALCYSNRFFFVMKEYFKILCRDNPHFDSGFSTNIYLRSESKFLALFSPHFYLSCIFSSKRFLYIVRRPALKPQLKITI